MIIFKNKILNIKVFSVKEAFKNYKIFIFVVISDIIITFSEMFEALKYSAVKSPNKPNNFTNPNASQS